MLRDAAVALIQEQLAFRTTLASNIATYLQFAQTNLESGFPKPWFMVQAEQSIVTVSGTRAVAVPSGFLEEVEQTTLRYIPTVVTALTPERDLLKDEYDVLLKNYMDLTTGTIKTGSPEAYALLGSNFQIFPTPDAIYTIKIINYGADTSLATNIENNWLKYFPLLLMGKAGKMISMGPIRDNVAFGVFSQWEAEGMSLLLRQNYSRELANSNMQVGGPH